MKSLNANYVKYYGPFTLPDNETDTDEYVYMETWIDLEVAAVKHFHTLYLLQNSILWISVSDNVNTPLWCVYTDRARVRHRHREV